MTHASDRTTFSGLPHPVVELPAMSAASGVGLELMGLAVSQSQTFIDSFIMATKCRSPHDFIGLTTHFWADTLRQQMAASAKIAGMLAAQPLKLGQPETHRPLDKPSEQHRNGDTLEMSSDKMKARIRDTFVASAESVAKTPLSLASSADGQQVGAQSNERKSVAAISDEANKSPEPRKDLPNTALAHSDRKNLPLQNDDHERKNVVEAHDEPKKAALHHNELKNAPKNNEDNDVEPKAKLAASHVPKNSPPGHGHATSKH